MSTQISRRNALFSMIAATSILAACSSPAPAPTAAPAKPAEPAKPIEIELLFPVAVGGPIAKIMDDYMARFNKANPGITAKATFAGGYADVLTKVQTTIQGGGKPAPVGVLLSTDLQSLIDADLLEPLDGYLAKAGDAYVNDFFPAFMLNSKDEKGKVWGIPFQRSTPVMYYNKAAFKEVGLNPDQPPKNWAELLDAAKKLTKPDGARWGLQVPSDGFPYWLFQAGPISLGKNVVGTEANKVYFDTPESLEALNFFVSLSQKEKVHPTGVIPWATTPDAFVAGKAAMIYHTTGSLTNILSKMPNPADVGVAFIPGKSGYGVPTGGGNMYIFKGAPQEQKDAAWKLIQFLSAPEMAAEWSRDTGYVASRKSAYDTEIMKKLVAEKPQYGIARDQLQYAQKELTSHQGAQIQQIYGNAIQAAVEGKKDPKTALVDAQAQADKILSQFK